MLAPLLSEKNVQATINRYYSTIIGPTNTKKILQHSFKKMNFIILLHSIVGTTAEYGKFRVRRTVTRIEKYIITRRGDIETASPPPPHRKNNSYKQS